MPGGGKVAVQEVPGAELDEAGCGAVGAGKPVAFSDGTVHDELHGGRFREDGAEDRGGAHRDARQFLELVCRGEGDAGNAQCAAELPGDEGFVVRGHIQVESRLLPVAQEYGLDDAYADLRVDMGTVLHGEAGIGVHPFERNTQGGKGFIDLLLERRGKGRRGRGERVAYMEHAVNVRKNPLSL